PGDAYYLPLAHRAASAPSGELGSAVGEGWGGNLPSLDSEAMRPLVEMLEDPGISKVGQNLKYDLLVLRRAGVEMRGLDFDTMIASYVLDPGRREHGLDSLALQYLDHRMITYEELCGKGKDQRLISECPIERVTEYACEDVDVTLRLRDLFEADLERYALEELFSSVEMPLVRVLADMEWSGIRIDPEFFAEVSRK